MLQRGKKSTASLASVSVLDNAPLPPPDDLSDLECEVWRAIVATKERQWWDSGSIPLLAAYARAVVQSRTVGRLVREALALLENDATVLPRYRELRALESQLSKDMVSLAIRMRLTQQARYVPDKAASRAAKIARQGLKPWQQAVGA